MSIFMGNGAIGYNKHSKDSTGDIFRFLQSDRHTPRVEQGLEHSLQTRKRIVIQLDSYGDGSNRGWHNDQNLINFTEATIQYVIERANAHGISYANLKKICRFTFDNEADEIYSPQEYGHYLEVFAGQMNGRFEIGAGNFNGHRTDYYNYMLMHHYYMIQWLDFHMQKDFETMAKVNANIPYYHNKAITYGMKLACTEANPTSNNIWTSVGYGLFHHQLVKSIEVNCKEFYFVFIQQPMDNNHAKISFILNNGDVNPHWSSFRQIIQDNKPIEKKGVKDGMIIETVGIDDVNYGNRITQLHRVLVLTGYMTEDEVNKYYKFDSATETAVKKFQTALKITMPWVTIDGRVGRQTWDLLIADIPDASERNAQWRTFNFYNSPRNKDGDM